MGKLLQHKMIRRRTRMVDLLEANNMRRRRKRRRLLKH